MTKRHPVLTGFLVAVAVIVVTIVVAVALAAPSPHLGNVAGAAPASSVPAPVQSQPAATPTPPASLLHLPMATVVDVTQGETDAARLKVVHPYITTQPGDSYGDAPANGYYLIIEVRARALNSYSGGFEVNPFDFYVKAGGGQHFDEDDGNAEGALNDQGMSTELNDTTLAAGESTHGLLVFDIPSAHGTIVYAPNLDGQPLASWKF